MVKPVILHISISLILLLSLSQLAFSQPQPGYEKTAIFSGYTPDKGQLIFYFTIKGERASSASAVFVPQAITKNQKSLTFIYLVRAHRTQSGRGLRC